MAQLFSVKKGALLPSQVWTLTSSVAFDLSAATSVKFVYRLRDGDLERTEADIAIVDAAAKSVRLDLTTDMVAAEGVYQCHVEIVLGGNRLIIPHVGLDTFVVTETI